MHLTRDMSELHASRTAETVVFAKTGEHVSLVIQSAPAAGEEQTFKDDASCNESLASGEKVQVTSPSKMPVTSQLQPILKRQRAATTPIVRPSSRGSVRFNDTATCRSEDEDGQKVAHDVLCPPARRENEVATHPKQQAAVSAEAILFCDILESTWRNDPARRGSGLMASLSRSLATDSRFLADFRFAMHPYSAVPSRSIGNLRAAGSRKHHMQLRKRDILSGAAADLWMPVVRVLGYVLSKVWRRMFRSVQVSVKASQQLKQVVEKGQAAQQCVLITPAHKSHVDYLMLSYLCFGLNVRMPCIAAGNNLSFGLVGAVFRRAGSFFIRRCWGGDEVYRSVIGDYMRRLTATSRGGGPGLPIEIFLEGGRSRTGMLRRPQAGLLRLIAEQLLPACQKRSKRAGPSDVLMMPIAISYDWVPETEALVCQRLGKPKSPESLMGVLQAAYKLIFGAWSRGCFGSVYINSATSVALRQHITTEESLGDVLQEAAQLVYQSIARATIAPVSALLALVILSHRDSHGCRFALPMDHAIDELRGLCAYMLELGCCLPMCVHSTDKLEAAVFSCLNAMGLRVSSESRAILVDLSAPRRTLGLIMAMNQMVHWLLPPALQYVAKDTTPAAHQLLREIIQGELWYADFSTDSSIVGATQPPESVMRMLRTAVGIVVDPYSVVAKVLTTGALVTGPDAANVAVQVQHLLLHLMSAAAAKNSGAAAMAELLALDTLQHAIEFFTRSSSVSGSSKMLDSVWGCLHTLPRRDNCELLQAVENFAADNSASMPTQPTVEAWEIR